jgi:RNA polymerase sigma-70 factor (ECF subfamily)
MNYTLLPDEQLIMLLQHNDLPAFNEIYRRYSSYVFVSLLRRSDKETARELTQLIFTSIWEKRNVYEIKKLKHYLYAAVKYSVLNHRKSGYIKQRYLLFSSATKTVHENKTASLLLSHELTTAIHDSIEKLPPKTQLIFKLSRFYMQSARQIAAAMRISEKTVEYHITQSLKSLRISLKEFM